MQSRYYDPVPHRFLTADSYASTGQGILGTNMFAYCRNNPVKRVDSAGFSDKDDSDGDGDIYEVELYGGGGSGSSSRTLSPPPSNTSSNPPNNTSGYNPPSGGGGVSNVIQVDNMTVEFGHGGRHLENTSLNVNEVNQAIANDVVTKQFPSNQSGIYDQYVTINGYGVVYNAFMRSSNHINIGTYHVVN